MVFGKKAPVSKNSHALISKMKKNDEHFAEHLKDDLPSNSKKYKRLMYDVGRWSQSPDNDNTAIESEDTPKFKSRDASIVFEEVP